MIKDEKGFTLLELMIAVSLGVILLYLFTRTGLTASVLPGWDNLSSRCTP